MCKETYFRLNKPVTVVTVIQKNDADSFQIGKDLLGEIVDRRAKALFLQGWVRVASGPNDEFFVKLSSLRKVACWLTEDEYHTAVAATQILQQTWLDNENQQFELIEALEAHQWVQKGEVLNSAPVFLPTGTVGIVYELSWDFEGTDDKQYWMMGIKTTDGRRYDAMYPDLLKASKPHVNFHL